MPVYIVALLAVIIWGASPVATKIAVTDLPPPAVALLRTVLGGLVALLLALSLNLPLPKNRQQRWLLALSAGCGFIGFPILFSIGVRLTSANHASIILAALPVFTAAIANAWDRRRPTRSWWLGVALAMIGEYVLIAGRPAAGEQTATLTGDLMVFVANGFASLGYVAGGRLQQAGYPSINTTFWGAGIAAILLLPLVPLTMTDTPPAEVSPEAWSALAYLAIGVTIVGYVMWYWALGKGGIARLGLMQFLQPVSGVALAAVLLGERIGPVLVAAAALVLAGVWIAVRPQRH